MPTWLETAEAAAALGLPTDTIRQYARRGVLERKMVGRTVLISAESIKRYQAKRRPYVQTKKHKERSR
jgi:excisionase family DNA binding protein